MADIIANIDIIVGALTLIVSGLVVLAKLTPTPKDDEVVGKVQKFLLTIRSIFTIKK